MRIASFTRRGRASFGLVKGEAILDLQPRTGLSALDEAFRVHGEATFAVLRAHETMSPDFALGDVSLEKPLAAWGKCFCVGVNYPERNAEYRDGSQAPGYPSLFVRFPDSFVGPGEALVRPPESAELDYEGEIVMVIGKGGRRIRQEDWREHVFGWTLGNEGTIRDWVRHGKFNVTPGKNWPGSGAIGPWIVTSDEAGDQPFELVTHVNGEERQRDTTARMSFPFGQIVAYVSTFCALAPGDVIFTGTPAGAGARMTPPRYLAPGDRVEVYCPRIGRLSNKVRDE
jgi:5-carboxymethyl-2-hydroxymuconate isomerase